MKFRIAAFAFLGATIVTGWLGLLADDQPAQAPIRISPRVLAAQGFPGQGFGASNREQQLVPQYDKDGDGRLSRQERDAARSSSMPRGGFAMRGFRFGAEGSPGRALTPADVQPYPTTPIYDLGTMRTMFLQFEQEDWEEELAAFNNTDVEIPATMIVDGRTYKGVGVHFRGASSFMMVPPGLKRSLNVSTDFTVEDQDLGGYRTFNLLNAANDPTFLRAFLYTQIARSYIPVPKMNFMRVVINGESWGVYLNAQQFNGDMLREIGRAHV